MTSTVLLADIATVHYGAALKDADRHAVGDRIVYGSSGVVGKHDAAIVDYPTIIVGRKGSVGNVTFAPNGGWPIDTAFYLELRDPDTINLRYLYWALSSAGLQARAITTSIPGLSRDELYRLRLRLPPLAEQRRVADLLDRSDAVRRKREESRRLVDELLRSVFLEMFGDPVRNEKGWKVVQLKDCLELRPAIGTTRPAEELGTIRVVRVGELGGYSVALDRCAKVNLSVDELARFQVKPGDLLLARAIGSEAHLGKASVYQGPESSIAFDSHVMRIRLDQSKALPSFLWHWLQTSGGRQRFMALGRRTAVQFNINAKQMASLPIPLPPHDLQSAFASFVGRVVPLRARITEKEVDRLSGAIRGVELGTL